MTFPVSLVIPTIESREELRKRALRSADSQLLEFRDIFIQHAGPSDDAAATRQHGLDRVDTEWVSFLDDDDELEPDHLQSLLETQSDTGADVVYAWFTCYENDQPVPDDSRQLWLAGKSAFGRPWSETHVQELLAGRWCFHLTALFRTDLIREIGGFQAPNRGRQHMYLSEDLDLEQRLVRYGAKVVHCPKRTWRWHFWSGRTKGQPSS